jgi:hypothetical protein
LRPPQSTKQYESLDASPPEGTTTGNGYLRARVTHTLTLAADAYSAIRVKKISPW